MEECTMFVAQHAGWQLIQDEDGELYVKGPQDINQLIELQMKTTKMK